MSKVIFKTRRVVVIHGDSVPLIPMLRKKKVTAIIADPPYGIGHDFNHANRKLDRLCKANDFGVVENDDKPFDPTPWVDFDKVVLFGANNFQSKLPRSNGWIVWDKNGGRDFNMSQGDAEMAWTNITGAVRIYRQLWRGVLRDDKGEPQGSVVRVYPSQKPVGLFYWIIKRFTKPGDIICDPYMGSGTTLLAALKAGRQCIGI
ncbi:hypothetical protein LCGC14_2893680, partial [marine sediment metagenome]